MEKDPKVFLLVISLDKAAFEAIIKEKGIAPENYAVVSTRGQKELFKVLAIADVGILIREDHPMNWASRPTKVMEYLACGLTVEHNSTVRWVIDVVSEQEAAIERKAEEATKLKKTASKITAAKKAPKVTLKKPAASKVGKTVSKATGTKTKKVASAKKKSTTATAKKVVASKKTGTKTKAKVKRTKTLSQLS